MAANLEPSTAIGAYKAIIDQLVEDANTGIAERLLREEGTFSRSPDAQLENALAKSLTNEQRSLLAEVIRKERIGGVHNALSILTWWMECRDVGLTFRGEPMPFELSGMGLHGDFIGRLQGWGWPEDKPL